MGFLCPKCGCIVPGNENSLMWHLKNIHHIIIGREFTESVTCNQNECQRTYSGRVSILKKHLKKHAESDDDVHVQEAVHGPRNSDDENGNNSDHDEAHAPADGEEGDGDAEMWDDFGQEEVEERAAVP